MAKKIEILITAKNMVAGGLKKAKSAISGFSAGAAKSVAVAGASIAAVAGASIAAGAKLIAAYEKQVKAENALAAAHRANGENAALFINAERKMAGAIAAATGRSKAETTAIMAKLRSLGIAPAALDKATKASIALAAAGMGEQQAMRATTMAMTGNFQLLQRLSPEIRNARTETEKLAAFNKLCAFSYDTMQRNMGTVGGMTKAIKNEVSGLTEQLGRFISQTNVVQVVLHKVKDAATDARVDLTKALDIREARIENKELLDANREVSALTAQIKAYDSAASSAMRTAVGFSAKAHRLLAGIKGKGLKGAYFEVGVQLADDDVIKKGIADIEKELERKRSFREFLGDGLPAAAREDKEIDALTKRLQRLHEELARRETANGNGDSARLALVQKLAEAEARRDAIIKKKAEEELALELEKRRLEEQDAANVSRILELHERVYAVKKQMVAIHAQENDLKNAQRELVLMQRINDEKKRGDVDLKKAAEDEVKRLEEILNANRAHLEMPIDEARKAKEEARKARKEREKADRREDAFMARGARLDKMDKQGAHLTKGQRRDLEIYRERVAAINKLNAAANIFPKKLEANAAGMQNAIKAVEGVIANENQNIILADKRLETVNEGIWEQTQKIETIRDAIDAMPSISDLTKEVEETTRKIEEMKLASDLWQSNIEHYTHRQEDRENIIKEDLERANALMKGISDYLYENLRSL